MSQTRFPTSREVYHRIRWDPRLDAREFVIGYDAHGDVLEEMPFGAFVPDGEIPWHRVWLFKHGRRVVWDRRERLDLLDSLIPHQEAPRALDPPAEGSDLSAGFSPLFAHRFDVRSGTWLAVSPTGLLPATPTSRARLSLVTFNVLFDVYDAEWLATERRIPAALTALRDCDADVLALQEVTAAFLAALLAEPWVRERYWSSDAPGSATVNSSGQVLLSRIPFATLAHHVFSRDKRLLVGRLALAEDAPWVVTTHLTSSRSAEGPGLRGRQLQTLLSWAQSLGDAPLFLAGDLNVPEDAPETAALARAGFVDAWFALRPGASGETYDPARNALAALTTRSGRRQRLDRVLVRDLAGRWSPDAVTLFAESPLPGLPSPGGEPLFISDHFGVRCEVRRGPVEELPSGAPEEPLATASLTHHTAVVLIPPARVWPPIQALRAKHDAKFERWMPHVTLLYPFVEEQHFDAAEARLRAALQSLQPFEVTLADAGHFDHRASRTVWLRPEDSPRGALHELHAALQAVMPARQESTSPGHTGFTPHLSVGQLQKREDVAQAIAQWFRHWRPLSFEVTEVCIIRRVGDAPFEVVRRVPLGNPGPGGRPDGEALRSALDLVRAPVSGEARAIREAAVRRLASACVSLGAEMLPYGSFLLGTDDGGSDVDAVAIGPGDLSREDFAHGLNAWLTSHEPEARARDVSDAAIPLFKLRLQGVSFDLAYARRPEGVAPCPPEVLLARHGAAMDPAGFRAVNGWADTRALLDRVAVDGAGLERFREVLRGVKVWARARGLYSHALGYLGGMSWAILAAWACVHAPGAGTGSTAEVLAYLFETFARWPWPRPVTLTESTSRYRAEGRRDILPVIAPALPPRNTARNVSRSTAQTLRDELERAQVLVARARDAGTVEAWRTLFEPAMPRREPRTRLAVRVEAATAESRERALGWVRGHMTALVYGLESERSLFVRPFEDSATEGFVLGLSSRAPEGLAASFARRDSALARTLAEFRADFEAWPQRPPDASLHLEPQVD
ncbi:DUF504 domain-containing protein [Corallococcus sp. M34]|uniref:poly(A) polymerase n=1 Tax=Citreicoccus inhibens TaxID=2849499 RepID=UPI001C224EDC|nr:poly(A) polymerase [Citreicoccus inhibens]MBU8898212.1 DUF504 domain-containing protein [Citreicoccus inhibens]